MEPNQYTQRLQAEGMGAVAKYLEAIFQELEAMKKELQALKNKGSKGVSNA